MARSHPGGLTQEPTAPTFPGMSLFDFFFPEQAQAAHLRRLADQSGAQLRKLHRAGRQAASQDSLAQLQERVDRLRGDLGFVTLVLGSLVARLDRQGVVTRADLQAAMSEVDGLDDLSDGQLDIERLKAVLSSRQQSPPS